ncbi:Protein of unknown function [Bacillus mycoides]|nr:Protein of unknown function [Bacillus mycoides]
MPAFAGIFFMQSIKMCL